jgi:hypothetical protein
MHSSEEIENKITNSMGDLSMIKTKPQGGKLTTSFKGTNLVAFVQVRLC